MYIPNLYRLFVIPIQHCCCLIFILLFSYGFTQAQGTLFSQITTTPSTAYALRLLNGAYTGALIEVRHGTNNATALVYPDASGNISANSSAIITGVGTSSYSLNATVTFSTFYKSATVFVVNWFDQSGNQRHLTQSNTTYQPRIVAAGTLQLKNLKTTLNFNNLAFMYTTATANWLNTNYTIAAVITTPSSAPSVNYFLGAGRNTAGLMVGWGQTNGFIIHHNYNSSSFGRATYTTTSTSGEQAVWNVTCSANGSTLNKNACTAGEDQSNPVANLTIDSSMFIGRSPTSSLANYFMFNGLIQEVITWPATLASTERYTVESNQCVFFGLPYAPAPVTGLSANINSTTQNIDLSWTAPASNYSAITDYVIEYQQEGVSTWTVFNDGTSTSTNASIGILPDATRYRFRVSAVNSGGQSRPALSPYLTTPQTISLTYSSSYTNLGDAINITIAPNIAFTGTISITPSGGGLSSTNAVNASFTNDFTARTYSFTPTSSAVVTITTQVTRNGQSRTDQKLFTIANPSSSTFMLDETGLSTKGAFSLRQLRSAYKGPVIKIRFSDNSEADITPDVTGFLSANSVATITASGASSYQLGEQVLLSTFLQTISFGYLVQWYDQSGNAKHLSAQTANQPVIYLTNLLLPYPYIIIGGSSYLTGPALIDGGDQSFTINTLTKTFSTSGNARIFHQSGSSLANDGTAAIIFKNISQVGFSGQNNDVYYTTPALSTTYLNINSIRVNAPGSACSVNGITENSTTLPAASLNIGNTFTYIGRKPDGTDNQSFSIYELIISGDYLNNTSIDVVEKNQLRYYDGNRSIYAADAPTGVTVTSTANNGEARLSWNSAAYYSTTSTVTSYQVEYKTIQASTWTVHGTTTFTYLIIAGLNSSQTYQFRVKAINAAGTGNASTVAQLSFIPQLTITGPVCGYTNSQSQLFTVTTSQAFSGTVTITPSGGGLNNAFTLNFTTASTSQTFAFTPTTPGNVTLTVTNTGGQGNPLPLLYTVMTSQTRLLNMLTNVNHAFSIRQLLNTYTGPCMGIRQESTNANGLVYFDANGEISENAIVVITQTGTSAYSVNQRIILGDFIAQQNIYITTWYNQVNTNAFNLQQTINAHQPLLASVGVLNRNGKVYLKFNASNQNFLSCSEGKQLLPAVMPFTINAVASSTSNATQRLFNQSNPQALDIGLCIKNGYLHFGGQGKDVNYSGLPAVTDGHLNLLTLKVAPPLCTGSVNGISTEENLGVSSLNIGISYVFAGRIGTTVNGSVYYGDYFDGGMSELIIYHSELSASQIALQESLQAAYYGLTLSTILQWQGTSNSQADNATNWSNQSVPSNNVSIIIPSGTVNSPVISGTTLNVKNIYLYPGTDITVSSNGSLNISGDITNDGKGINNNGTIYFSGSKAQSFNASLFSRCQNLSINNTSGVAVTGPLSIYGTLSISNGTCSFAGGLTLKSTATGTAQISEIGNGSLTGTVTAERYIPAIARRWRFVGSQVKNAKWTDWQKEIFITGTGGSVNGFDSTQQNSNSAYWYNETTPGSSTSGWTAISSTSNTIETGRGYRLFIRGDRTPGRLTETMDTQNEVTLDISGEVNQGNITMPVSYTNNTGDQNDGWNLLANPYPCAISWNTIHDENRIVSGNNYSGSSYQFIDPTVFVYDPASNSYKYYNALSDAGNLTGGIIGSGQAFFVRASASGAALTIAERHKSTSPLTGLYKTASPGFLLRLTYDTINYDETFVKFTPQSSYLADDYDVTKMYAPVGLGSISADKKELSVNCLPETALFDTIQLSLTAKTKGSYELSHEVVEQLTQPAKILLFDRYTQTTASLSDKNYRFIVSNDTLSYAVNRFMVWLDSLYTGLPNPSIPSKQKFTIGQDATNLYIKGCQQNQRYTINLFSVTGALVVTHQQETDQGQITIPIKQLELAPGIYGLQILTNGAHEMSCKVIIN